MAVVLSCDSVYGSVSDNNPRISGTDEATRIFFFYAYAGYTVNTPSPRTDPPDNLQFLGKIRNNGLGTGVGIPIDSFPPASL